MLISLVRKILVNMATGHDGLSAKTLKLVAPSFIHPLCRLLNLLIVTDTFPDKLKVGQVTPLQGGQHRERNNYRHISVLPILSNIIKKNCM